MTLVEQIHGIPFAATRKLSKIITHANCPDGIASAMLLRVAFPKLPIEFVYHGSPEHNQEPCPALFCDFSPPAERARGWVDAGAIVLDHHATAKPVVKLFGDRGVFADEREHLGVSGAWLANLLVERLIGRSAVRDRFACLIGVRDTWQRDSSLWDRACHLSSALSFYGADYWLAKPTENDAWQPSGGEVFTGQLIYEKRLAAAAKVVERAEVITDGARSFILFNDSDKLTSDVGEAARAAKLEVDFTAGFFFNEAGLLTMSMRSVADDCDVGAIAKANGGGGHTKAAGFQCQPGFVDAPIEAMRRALARVQ